MGFLDSMKRALGFDGGDDNDIEIEGIDATVQPLSSRRQYQSIEPQRHASPPATDIAGEPAAPVSSEPDSRPDPSVIFEKVVAVFNESLPGFLQKSVDPARQRRALFDAMDASVKDYYEHLDRNTERRLQVRFENDRRKLQAQIEELRIKARKEEEGNSNAKNLQLSAERQKRALSERVHDLEKQLATLEAENEQYILENKSMANKLRMAALAGDAPDGDLAAETQKLQDQIAELQKTSTEAEQRCAVSLKEKTEVEEKLKDAHKQIEALEKQIAIHSESETDDMELLESVNNENNELKRSKEELEAEIARLRDSLEQAKVKDDLGVAMVNDLNSKARVAKNEASEAKTEAENARSEAAAARNEAERAKSELENSRKETDAARNEAKALEQKLTVANEQMAALNARLTKAQEDLKVVKEIQQEVLKLEEKQRVTDAQLRSQKDEMMEKDEQLKMLQADILSKNTTMRIQEETIRRLEDQTDSLRKNVENTLYEKSQIESALRSEIERLKSIKGTVSDIAIETSTTVVSVVEEPRGEDLTLDMPDFVLPKREVAEAPKPRRGRPPKQSTSGQDVPARKESDQQSKSDFDADMDLIDSTDWLIASPQEDAKPKSRRKNKVLSSDDSFGYKEPERQEPPDNPAQMLLW